MRFPHDSALNATPNTSLSIRARDDDRNLGGLGFIQHRADVLNLGLEFMAMACDFGPGLLGRDFELLGTHRIG